MPRIFSLDRHVLPRAITSDLAGLYLVQAVQVTLPIVMIPYLARRLGPSSWGTVAFFQSFALYLGLLIEFGFGLSATRRIAGNRESLKFRAEILAEVAGAKAILSLLALGVFILASFLFAPCRPHPAHLFSAALWCLAQGFNLAWYFQGLSEMRKFALIELVSRVFGAMLIVVTVRKPADGWLVLLCNATGATIATALSSRLAYQHAEFVMPTWSASLAALRIGFPLFLSRSAVSLYTLGNSFILGIFCPPIIVGFYAGAERISKGILTLVQPLNQTMYTYINAAILTSRVKAAHLACKNTLIMTALGFILSAFVYSAAPVLVRIILGPNFEPAIPAVRIMSPLPMLVCVASSLGSNWALPMHLDHLFTGIVLFGGISNILLAVILAPPFKHLGMCIAAASSEAIVGLSFLICLRIKKIDPFTLSRASKGCTTNPGAVHAVSCAPVA